MKKEKKENVNFQSHSPQETIKLAKKTALKLKGGDVLALHGNLGAGKTVFAQGIAQGLKIKKNVNSPTFTLMKIYPLSSNKNLKNFCHIDAYRLNSEEELMAIGALDFLRQKETITIIEWAEKIKNILPEDHISVKIENGHQESERIIKIKGL
ncbi:tRNA (adenosine(37)-N6)-threonylcarbamoyltransferase complex ATPase subunit type 1 TsaE [Patescibacteria group bacterium]|nr:tRNA (adenosine(37)-N6)-threonylcarbamoyltransferase complex ATPase subunit type 1 TsaE [Patescibacteria group bacterium]